MTDAARGARLSMTLCGNCLHPMHWHECGAGADLTAGPCGCRNDQAGPNSSSTFYDPNPCERTEARLAEAERLLADIDRQSSHLLAEAGLTLRIRAFLAATAAPEEGTHG